MAIRPSAPQSIGQVLDTSFKVFRASWAQVWWLALVGAVLNSAGEIYQALWAPQGESSWIVGLLKLIGVIAYIGVCAAIYLRQNNLAADAPTGGEIPRALRLLPRQILMTLAMMLVIAASIIPSGAFFAAANYLGWPVWVAVAGTVVLAVLPLYLIVNMIFSVIVLMLEDRRAVESLKASTRLVRGQWWRTFAVLSVGGVILMVAYALVGVVAALLAPILAQQEAVVTGMIIVAIAVVLVGVLVMPYFTALLLAQYYDLKLRKEGGDIAARIDALT